jgi:hypothetical protein
MDNTTALSALKNLPATKAESRNYVAKLKEEILAGEVNPLHARIFLKSIIDTLQAVCDDKEVKEYVMDAASRFGGKSFETNGAKVSIAHKTTWDYKVCNDAVWNSLKEQIKIREAILQSGTDASTGETFRKPDQKVSEFLQIEIQ